MTNSTANPIEGIAHNHSDVRPTYIPLGDDTEGASHVYRTTDETIHVVADGQRVQRFDLNGRSVDDYVAFVRDEVDGREWQSRRYLADDEDPIATLVEDIVLGLTA